MVPMLEVEYTKEKLCGTCGTGLMVLVKLNLGREHVLSVV